MKKALSLLMLSAFLLVGAGCESVEDDVVSDDVVADDVVDSEVYTWDDYGITFSVPEGENVLDTGGSALLISDMYDSVPESDVTVFETMMYVFDESEVSETFAAEIMEYDSVEVTIGDNTFDRSIEYQTFGDITVVHYVLEFDDYVMVYRVGQGDEEMTGQLLLSLEIE